MIAKFTTDSNHGSDVRGRQLSQVPPEGLVTSNPFFSWKLLFFLNGKESDTCDSFPVDYFTEPFPIGWQGENWPFHEKSIQALQKENEASAIGCHVHFQIMGKKYIDELCPNNGKR